MDGATPPICPILSKKEAEELSGYNWPFENLVVEGGGAKCIGAIGMYRVLEELGITSNIKRFAGASGGALFSTLAVIGYKSFEIEEIIGVNLKEISEDAWFGIFSFIPNLIYKYGLHSGENLSAWLGTIIYNKTGNPDTTFQKLYTNTGKELVITVTNLKQMDSMYCHVKTTPSMPIRKALRMSMGIPGVMQPICHDDQLFVDGGVLCNYPIKCFDGWYLSMAQEDMFLLKFQKSKDCSNDDGDEKETMTTWDTDELFGTYNKRTIGALVYSDGEEEILRARLEQRKKTYIAKEDIPKVPDTEKSRNQAKKRSEQKEALRCHNEMNQAMKRFVSSLAKSDKDMSGTISKDELRNFIAQSGCAFTEDDARLLFGQDKFDVDEIFAKLDIDENGEISFQELTQFAEEKGLTLMKQTRSHTEPVNGVGQYFESLINTLLFQQMKDYVKVHDIDRTIGIDTGYLNTMDFDMSKEDKEFLIQQGKMGCLAFLRNYIKTENLNKTHAS